MDDLNTSKSLLHSIGLSALIALAMTVGCSSSSVRDHFDDSLENDLRLRKKDVSRVGEGEGIRLSEALHRNLKTEPLKGERLNLINFISESLQASKKKQQSRQFFSECQNWFHQSPECVFLKPSWSDTWFDD